MNFVMPKVILVHSNSNFTPKWTTQTVVHFYFFPLKIVSQPLFLLLT